MSHRTWSLVIGALLLAMGMPVLAAGRGRIRGGGGPNWRNNSPDGEPSKNDEAKKFIVIQSGDTESKVTFDAIPSSELKSRIDELPAVYRDALKEWAVQKVDAEKNGEKFTRSKPGKPFVQDFMDKVYPSLNLARSVAEKCQERWDKQTPKKGEKDGDAKATDEKAAAPKQEKAVTDRKPVE